ncbi:hypothetical protein AV530_003674 [Patagioenas fasciata monilis]|uniref:Uncharacterized protein n=1 Tax=Patagioenas fasciata monilis TaxID=372326 RepID=A0A1V4KYV9_PATFA|nr:hypothetical protein AV530_003674 [Patagioenas fasciata monilis]
MVTAHNHVLLCLRLEYNLSFLPLDGDRYILLCQELDQILLPLAANTRLTALPEAELPVPDLFTIPGASEVLTELQPVIFDPGKGGDWTERLTMWQEMLPLSQAALLSLIACGAEGLQEIYGRDTMPESLQFSHGYQSGATPAENLWNAIWRMCICVCKTSYYCYFSCVCVCTEGSWFC